MHDRIRLNALDQARAGARVRARVRVKELWFAKLAQPDMPANAYANSTRVLAGAAWSNGLYQEHRTTRKYTASYGGP